MGKPLWSQVVIALCLWSAGGAAGWSAWRTVRGGRPVDPIRKVLDVGRHERRGLVRELARSSAPEARLELLRRVAELEDGETLAAEVLTEAMDVDPKAADPALEAFRERFPASPLVPVRAFSLRIKQGEFAEAVRIHREAAARVDHDEPGRRALLLAFLERMADAGRPAEALAEAGPNDAEYAFETLASRLHARRERGDSTADALLRAVIATQEFRSGPSPWTDYHAGLADEAARDDESALKRYADAMYRLERDWNWSRCGTGPAAFPDVRAAREERDRLQRRWASLLLRLGRWDSKFDAYPLAPETFDWLAQTYESNGRADDLKALVDRQQDQAPRDLGLPYWRGTIHWDRREYAEAVALYDEHLLSSIGPRRSVRSVGRKFRGLVRLGRLDEARAMLGPPGLRVWPDEERWEMILAAHDGREEALGRMLDEFTAARPDGTAQAYADPDLGPLLNSPRFDALRKRHPPPAP